MTSASRPRAYSSASSVDIVSPRTASTNASQTSLRIPSPDLDDPRQYVLAMHDYIPPHGTDNTCLSFRAGDVIHVLNRDPSGWWDGKLDGRRGWFPSNYVNAEIESLTEEQQPVVMAKSEGNGGRRRGHSHSQSTASATSWTTSSSAHATSKSRHSHSTNRSIHSTHSHSQHSHTHDDEDADSPYCPPLMIPLLHGLSILQNAVRADRALHYQPCAAYLISCVKAILSGTNTLQRESEVLQTYPELASQRRAILHVLALLVGQAKKAADETHDSAGETREGLVQDMLRLGGMVFSCVRTFLVTMVEFGIELPDDEDVGPAQTQSHSHSRTSMETPHTAVPASATPTVYGGSISAKTPTGHRGRPPDGTATTTSATTTATSATATTGQRPTMRLLGPRAPSKQEQYLRNRIPSRHQPNASISSSSGESSRSGPNGGGGNLDVSRSRSPPRFPSGPTSASQVLEALRYTHDQYLSTIAAFIGHAHAHSRLSHAASAEVLYDLVKEIIELVCKLLTIVEAVVQHPSLPSSNTSANGIIVQSRLTSLRQAKEGLYSVTTSLADSVRLLSLGNSSTMEEEEAEKQALLRSATGALKAGADCVTAVKVCLNRSTVGDRPFVVELPAVEEMMRRPMIDIGLAMSEQHGDDQEEEQEDVTIQAVKKPLREVTVDSKDPNFVVQEDEEEEEEEVPVQVLDSPPVSPTTQEDPTWDASRSSLNSVGARALEEKMINGDVPSVSRATAHEFTSETLSESQWMFGHEYLLEDVAYNTEGHLVGATLGVLVEKMTPHDALVDPSFSSVFFLTFRFFATPLELVDALIARYNLTPPQGISMEDQMLWQQRKGIPTRLRVSNFIKSWVEVHWRVGVDDVAIPVLVDFTSRALAAMPMLASPAQKVLELLEMRKRGIEAVPTLVESQPPGPRLGRVIDPSLGIGLSASNVSSIIPPLINDAPPPRPTMTKTLLVNLRKRELWGNISIVDFDPLELARQLTVTECLLYCAISPWDLLDAGRDAPKASGSSSSTSSIPISTVRAVSTLSTVITGWVAETILSEEDLKKRQALVKFFVKVGDRCLGLRNYATSRAILAALDSSVVSRLRATWGGLGQKYRAQLDGLRKLADHSRNFQEYRNRLKGTVPPAIPFLGLYLTDLIFCREGNPSHRTSPMNANKKLINFHKFHKLARIVQDMQRFQVSYNLKVIPEVQEYLNAAFENAKKRGGDLDDLYRRSLLIEPKQSADNATLSSTASQTTQSDMRQLFSWARQSSTAASS